MPISEAFVLCPHTVFLPPHFPRYAKASAEVMAILKSHDRPVQQVSIDETFIDMSARGDYPGATALATRIRNDIHTQLGLTCSIGVAPTKLVAKIASDVDKPDGLTVAEPKTCSHSLPRYRYGRYPVLAGNRKRSSLRWVSGRLWILLNMTSRC
jgi:DNA polymerase IV (DinB-like DNA polymerase)